jgi:hypothetical protein
MARPGGHRRYLARYGQVFSMIGRTVYMALPGGHRRYLGRYGQVCSMIGQTVYTQRPPYPAAGPVGSSPLPGLPWSGMPSVCRGGIYATPIVSGSRAGGVIHHYLGCHGQVCSLIGQGVSTPRPPYLAAGPVGSSPLPGLPWSGMPSVWPGGIYDAPTISGSRAGGVIAATLAPMRVAWSGLVPKSPAFENKE